MWPDMNRFQTVTATAISNGKRALTKQANWRKHQFFHSVNPEANIG
jgi:hypothetical protein